MCCVCTRHCKAIMAHQTTHHLSFVAFVVLLPQPVDRRLILLFPTILWVFPSIFNVTIIIFSLIIWPIYCACFVFIVKNEIIVFLLSTRCSQHCFLRIPFQLLLHFRQHLLIVQNSHSHNNRGCAKQGSTRFLTSGDIINFICFSFSFKWPWLLFYFYSGADPFSRFPSHRI